MRRLWLAAVLCVALLGCTLSRPHYVAPDVSVGESAFVRAMEAWQKHRLGYLFYLPLSPLRDQL